MFYFFQRFTNSSIKRVILSINPNYKFVDKKEPAEVCYVKNKKF